MTERRVKVLAFFAFVAIPVGIFDAIVGSALGGQFALAVGLGMAVVGVILLVTTFVIVDNEGWVP